MILVTGGTGFVGQILIRQLAGMGYQVRTLLRPSLQSPRLPLGVAVEAVVCSLKDQRGLRAAMSGVEAVFHLAAAEQKGGRADLQGVDIDGSRAVAEAAAEAGVRRLVFPSHLGADRASAYPLLKAKGIAERLIIQGGVPYTILRSGLIYGNGDHFTINLARLLKQSPLVFLLPGDGGMHLQPLRVDDLVISMILAMEDPRMENQMLQIGGPEYLTLRDILDMIAAAVNIKRYYVNVPPPYLRALTLWSEQSSRNFPVSIFWQDYLAADRTCDLDTLPRLFGLMPARMAHSIEYLKNPDLLKR